MAVKAESGPIDEIRKVIETAASLKVPLSTEGFGFRRNHQHSVTARSRPPFPTTAGAFICFSQLFGLPRLRSRIRSRWLRLPASDGPWSSSRLYRVRPRAPPRVPS
jgi:hypothetical protein